MNLLAALFLSLGLTLIDRHPWLSLNAALGMAFAVASWWVIWHLAGTAIFVVILPDEELVYSPQLLIILNYVPAALGLIGAAIVSRSALPGPSPRGRSIVFGGVLSVCILGVHVAPSLDNPMMKAGALVGLAIGAVCLALVLGHQKRNRASQQRH